MKKFLLHVCCGPCSIIILQELQKQYDLTVHFYNPNIHPREEYDIRRDELVALCEEMKIPVVEEEYNVDEWFRRTKGLEEESEGGKRCRVCFHMRLDRVARYAKEHDFDLFSTSLTMGRNKKAEVINPLGIALGKAHGVEFYVENWKKKGRIDLATAITKERGMYRQEYCGCVYSDK